MHIINRSNAHLAASPFLSQPPRLERDGTSPRPLPCRAPQSPPLKPSSLTLFLSLPIASPSVCTRSRRCQWNGQYGRRSDDRPLVSPCPSKGTRGASDGARTVRREGEGGKGREGSEEEGGAGRRGRHYRGGEGREAPPGRR